jgi:hypothetical protein
MLARKDLPSQEYLKDLFSYSDTNKAMPLTYKKRPKYAYAITIGDNAGSLDTSCGYYRVRIKGSLYKLHRIIFKYHNGWCPDEIDHEDCDKSNNLIGNLRTTTSSQNVHSRGLTISNTSGYKGVSFVPHLNKYKSQIRINDELIYLGVFHTPQDAHKAYANKATEIHGDYANTG